MKESKFNQLIIPLNQFYNEYNHIISRENETLTSDEISIINQIKTIDKWSNTVIFKNKHHSNLNSIKEDILQSLEKAIDYINSIIATISNEINYQIIDTPFITYVYLNDLFYSLEDHNSECKAIKELLSLNQFQERKLHLILEKYVNTANCLMISKSMILIIDYYSIQSNNRESYEQLYSIVNYNKEISLISLCFKCNKIFSDYDNIDKAVIEFIIQFGLSLPLISFIDGIPEKDIEKMVFLFENCKVVNDLSLLKELMIRLNIKKGMNEAMFINNVSQIINNRFDYLSIIRVCNDQLEILMGYYKNNINEEEFAILKAEKILSGCKILFDQDRDNDNKCKCELLYMNEYSKIISNRELHKMKNELQLFLFKTQYDKGRIMNIIDKLRAINEANDTIQTMHNKLIEEGYPIDTIKEIYILNSDISNLISYIELLDAIYFEWKETTKDMYMKNYLLTHFHGHQFWNIENSIKTKRFIYLSNLISYSMSYSSIKELKYISLLKLGLIEENISAKKRLNQVLINMTTIINSLINKKEIIDEINCDDSTIIHPLSFENKLIAFISVDPEQVVSSLLSIYISHETKQLPQARQLLLYSSYTTTQEVNSFRYRVITSVKDNLFSIIIDSILSNEALIILQQLINQLIDNSNQSQLLIISRNDVSNKSLLTILQTNDRVLHLTKYDLMDQCLLSDILHQMNLNLFIIHSDRPGVGKSYYIKEKYNEGTHDYFYISLNDIIDINALVNQLNNSKNEYVDKQKFLHIHIGNNINDYQLLNYALFSIIVLGCLKSNNDAFIFNCKEDIAYIEVSNSENETTYKSCFIFQLFPYNEVYLTLQNTMNTFGFSYNINFSVQIQLVMNYLLAYDQQKIDAIEIEQSTSKNMTEVNGDQINYLLDKYLLSKCNNKDKHIVITLRGIIDFINVLYTELTAFSSNSFFRIDNILFIRSIQIENIRSCIIERLVQMAIEITVGLRDITLFSFSKYIIFYSDLTSLYPITTTIPDDINSQPFRILYSSQMDWSELSLLTASSSSKLYENLLAIIGNNNVNDISCLNREHILSNRSFMISIVLYLRIKNNLPVVLIGNKNSGKRSFVNFFITKVLFASYYRISLEYESTKGYLSSEINKAISIADEGNQLFVIIENIDYKSDYLGTITDMIANRYCYDVKLPSNISFILIINCRIDNADTLPYYLISNSIFFQPIDINEEVFYIKSILMEEIESFQMKEKAAELIYFSHEYIKQNTNNSIRIGIDTIKNFSKLYQWFKAKNKYQKQNKSEKQNNCCSNINNLNHSLEHNHIDSSIQKSKVVIISNSSHKQNKEEEDEEVKVLVCSFVICYYYLISDITKREEYKRYLGKTLGRTVTEIDSIIQEEQNGLINDLDLPIDVSIPNNIRDLIHLSYVCISAKVPLVMILMDKFSFDHHDGLHILIDNLKKKEYEKLYLDNSIKVVPVYLYKDTSNNFIELEWNKVKKLSSNLIQPIVIMRDIDQYYQLFNLDNDCYSMSILCLLNYQCDISKSIIDNCDSDRFKLFIERKDSRNIILVTNNEINDICLLFHYLKDMYKDKAFFTDISDDYDDNYVNLAQRCNNKNIKDKFILSQYRNNRNFETYLLNNDYRFIIFINQSQLSSMSSIVFSKFDKYYFTPDALMPINQIECGIQLKNWIERIFKPSVSKGIIIGYTETLHKYIYYKYHYYNDNKSNEQRLSHAKEEIISLCNCKLLFHLSLDKLNQDCVDNTSDFNHNNELSVYFNQAHDSLNQLISIAQKAIVYTYSEINGSIIITNTDYDSVDYSQVGPLDKYINSKTSLLLIKTNKLNDIRKIMNVIDRRDIQNKKIFILYYLSFDNPPTQYDIADNWVQITIDDLNGGMIEDIKEMMDLSLTKVLQTKINQRLFSIIINDIYTNLSFSVLYNDSISKYNHYIAENIKTLQTDVELYRLIHFQCLDYLETHQNYKTDWKEAIINTPAKISITEAIDTFIIKEYKTVLEKIIIVLETYSSMYSYTNGNDFIRDLWKRIAMKVLKKELSISYQSKPVINCLFKLSFPFSRIEIEKTVISIKEDINTIHLCNMNDYHKDKDNYLSHYNHMNKVLAINHMKTIINQSFIIKELYLEKTINEKDKATLIKLYYNDIITYVLYTEFKSDLNTMALIRIIIERYISIKTEDCFYNVFLFFYVNTTIIKLVSELIALFYCNKTQIVISFKRLEELLMDQSLYSIKESNVFLIIHNRLFLELIDEIINKPEQQLIKYSESIFKKGYELVFALSIISRCQIRELQLISLTKEYIKLLSLCSSTLKDNDLSIIHFIKRLWLNKELNNEDINYELMENDFMNCLQSDLSQIIIESKITIYHNLLFLINQRKIKQFIINQLLSNEELLTKSSNILYSLFNNSLKGETNALVNKSDIHFLLSNDNKIYFDTYYNSNPHQMIISSFSSCFLVEFFIKLYSHKCLESTMDLTELMNYLALVKDSFINAKKFIQDYSLIFEIEPHYSFYDKLVSFSIVKHCINIYGKYLSRVLKNSNTDSENEINSNSNTIEASLMAKHVELNTQFSLIFNNTANDFFNEIMRLYAFKSISSFLSFNLTPLANSALLDSLHINWIKILFRSDDNSLSLESGSKRYSKYKKMNYFIFNNLLKEENVNPKIKDLIKSSVSKVELKYVIIQQFVFKIWLNYTSKDFIKSKEHSIAIKLYDMIQEVLLSSYGKPTTIFIRNLIYNWPDNIHLQLNANLSQAAIGLLLLGIEMFTYIISLCSDNVSYLSTLFYQHNDKGMKEVITSFGHWKKLYLPGGLMDSRSESIIALKNEIEINYNQNDVRVGLYECVCGFLYTIGDCTRPYVISKCLNCKGPIGGTSHRIQSGHNIIVNADNPKSKDDIIKIINTKILQCPNYIKRMPDELNEIYTLRNLLPITFRFLNYLTHISLYLLNECSFVSAKALNEMIPIDDNQIPTKDYLLKHVTKDINIIKKLLSNNDDYLFIFIIYDLFTQSIINDEYNYDINTNTKRVTIESNFDSKVKQKSEKIAEEIEQYKSDRKKEDKEFNYFSLINEDFSEGDILYLSTYEYQRLFRYTKIGNWSDLTIEFYKKNYQSKYRCINLLINHYDDLSILASCFSPIIDFANYMLKKYNGTFYRQEAKDKTIEEVIKDDQVAIELYYKFESAWSMIGYKITRFGCKDLVPIPLFNKGLSVSFVLLDDKEMGYGLYLISALQYLALIQNNFLFSVYDLINENKDLYKGNVDTNRYPLQFISSDEIVLCHEDNAKINNMLRHYTKFSCEYKQGTVINYEFDLLEHEIIHLLTFNKKYINSETYNVVRFKLELLSLQSSHSNLIDDIIQLISQKEIEEIIKQKLIKKLNELTIRNKDLLFHFLQEVLLNIKYNQSLNHQSATQTRLKDYINQSDLKHSKSYDSIINECFNTNNDIASISLETIVSLYEMIELIIYDQYRDKISIDYQKTISNEYRDKIEQYFKSSIDNYNGIKYPLLSEIIKAIKRFIIRCLTVILESSVSTIEYMQKQSFWSIDVTEESIMAFYEEFPFRDITIAYTFDLLSVLEQSMSYLK